jgi:quercetin dioxygenase-like cupin family protein
MSRLVLESALGLTVLLPLAAVAQEKAAAPEEHRVFAPGDIQWQPGPASLPTGAKLAVLEGDPAKEGIFTMRISAPAGYKIPPHWHPAFEHVTTISGTFNMGRGETFDKTKGHAVPAGGFAWMAPGIRHFAWVDVETVVQVHGMGPWQLYYVNPDDDPRKAAPKK